MGYANLKPSKYNILSELNENEYLLFNCMSNGFAKLDGENKKIYQKIVTSIKKEDTSKFINKEKEMLDNLIKGRFIIEKDIDEIQLLKLRFQKSRFQKDVFGMTICPTLNCNLRCVYCFEQRRKSRLSGEQIEKIKKYFLNNIKQYKSVNIAWYGGEPLMYPGIIDELSDFFIKECKKNKKSYLSSIVTNGTLINKLDKNFFRRNKIISVQVTLDGPPDIHDKRRPYAGGKGTFDRILENLNIILKLKIHANIRCNVDNTNYDKIEPMLPILKPLKDKYSKLFNLYFSGVDNEGFGACKSIDSCMTRKEFSKYMVDLINISKKYSFDVHTKPLTKFGNCMISSTDQYVIDTDCNLYKCWNVVGEKEHCVGSIDEKGEVNLNNYPYWLKCVMDDPTDRKECRNCEVLPLCMGGCTIRSYNGSKMSPCSDEKFQIKELLKRYYTGLNESKTEQKAVS